MRGPAAIGGTLLVLALALGACAGGGEGSAASKAGTARGAAAAAAGRQVSCRAPLRRFLGSMDALRDGLAVGLSYEEYLAGVRRARAIHSQIDVERLSLGCLTGAGAPAERSLNRYIEGVNLWGDCLATASCEVGSVEPKLQRRWDIASDLLSTALEGLRGPRPRQGA